MFTDSCHDEHLSLISQQHIVVTVEDFVLRTEMTDLKSQEENLPKSILQIPVIVEKTLPVCGSRKFQIDVMGDHL
jgi:hypothetical protein